MGRNVIARKSKNTISSYVKRLMCTVFLALVFLLLFQNHAFAQDNDSIIRVGIFQNPPIVFIDDNDIPQGQYIDLLREIANEEGWDIHFVPGTWLEGLERLRSSEIDLMTSIAYLDEREVYMDFSHENVLTMWGQVYVHQDSDIQDILDLQGETVAILNGGINGINFMDMVSKFNMQCEFRVVETYAEVAELVASGDVAAGVINNVHGYEQEKQYAIRRSPIIFNPFSLLFAVPEGKNSHLLETIDSYLAKWKSDPESPYYSITAKWFGQMGKEALPDWVFRMLLIGLGILLFVAAWVLVLRRQVNIRTKKLKKRVKELKCLFSISDLTIKPGISLEKIFKEIVDRMPPGWQYPEITCSRIVFHKKEFKTGNFKKTKWKQAEDIKVKGKKVGVIEIYYLEKKPEIYEGPFLKEERNLVNGIVEIIIGFIERRQSEEELEKHRAHLEELVETRTQELVEANKNLESFSYSISHDLRAPLRSMDGFSQILLEDYADKLNEQGKHHLQRVRKASQHMSELIEDLLKFSRTTRQEIKYETVNLTQLAKALVKSLQDAEPKRQVEFIIQPKLVGKGNTHLLQLVLQNLLGNAWKFTIKNPSAKIELGVTQTGNKKTYFVRDNGVGFDMKYAGKLFGTFQRLHSDEAFTGTGIGLATVKRIINRHGGRVWAEGEVDKGACFYFTLPKKEKPYTETERS